MFRWLFRGWIDPARKYDKVTYCHYCGEKVFCKMIGSLANMGCGSYMCAKCEKLSDIEHDKVFSKPFKPSKTQLEHRRKRNRILKEYNLEGEER